jgi:hypothetical protein
VGVLNFNVTGYFRPELGFLWWWFCLLAAKKNSTASGDYLFLLAPHLIDRQQK